MKAFRPYKWPLNTDSVEDRHRWDDALTTRGGKRPPESVRNLRYTGGNEKVTLQWDPPVQIANVGGYRVYFDNESNLVREITDPGTTAADVVVNDPDPHNFFVSCMSSLKRESPVSQVVGRATGFVKSSLFNVQGSALPNQAILITIAYTDVAINLTWLQQSLLRPDNSTFILAAGSKSYTGLTASTQYHVYPRINLSAGTLTFSNGSPPPTTPSASMSLQQNLDGFSGIDVMNITTASGGGSGGGTGGGADSCPEQNEIVETPAGRILADNLRAGMTIKGHSFKLGSDVFRPVVAVIPEACAAWNVVNGRKVSPCEPVWIDGKWTMAFRVPGVGFDTTPSHRIRISVQADEYDEANFYLLDPDGGEPLLIHNLPPQVC